MNLNATQQNRLLSDIHTIANALLSVDVSLGKIADNMKEDRTHDGASND